MLSEALFLLFVAQEGLAERPGQAGGSLSGPLECIDREEGSYNDLKGVNVFLYSALPWGRRVPWFGCRMEHLSGSLYG